MKHARLGFLAVAVLAISLIPTAYAFHDGGVARCSGCHSMHYAPASAPSLLNNLDQSSTCLDCHEGSPGSYHISTPETTLATEPPTQHTAGGDFSWLKRDYAWSITRGTRVINYSEAGESHGHNIIAEDYNYIQESDKDYGQVDPGTGDPILEPARAPGGSATPYLAENLGCQSCHDPHGEARIMPDYSVALTGAPIYDSGSYGAKPVGAGASAPEPEFLPDGVTPNPAYDPAAVVPGPTGLAVGVYRLLRAAGSTHDGAVFNDTPFAITPSSYNRSEASSYTRVAYGNGMSQWCLTCHPGMDSAVHNVHPVDEDTNDIASIYDSYRGSGIMNGGHSDSFLSLTPFASNETLSDAGIDALAALTGATTGPETGDTVMCMSCHRAHASGFPDALRFQYGVELVIINGEWPATDAITDEARDPKWGMGRDTAEILAAYNDIPAGNFATYNRVFCNKCHAKD